MLVGLKSHSQPDSLSIDSTKNFTAPGWMFKNSFIKMMKGKQMKIQLDSCRSLTLSMQLRIKYSDSLLNVRDRRIVTLEELNDNYEEEIGIKEDQIVKNKKDEKKKRRRQGILVASVAFVLGLVASLAI